MRIKNEFSKYRKTEMGVRQWYIFSSDLFNHDNETNLRKLEVLTGFIICGHNLSPIRYGDDSMYSRHKKENTGTAESREREERTKHEM